jgi:hypothetical protein
LAAGLVDAVMLATQVECPVRLEVPVVDDGAEPEDGLGSLDAPPGAGDIEPVADQVAGRAFYHSGGDRPAGRECLVVAQVFLVGGQVAHARIYADPIAVAERDCRGGRVTRAAVGRSRDL